LVSLGIDKVGKFGISHSSLNFKSGLCRFQRQSLFCWIDSFMLVIISAYFNFYDLESRRRNFEEFRQGIGDRPFVCAELSVTGNWLADALIPRYGDPALNLFWQKERLLNLCLNELEPEVDKVAWLDTDIVFENPDWYEETSALLDKYPLVQLWETDGEYQSVASGGNHRGYGWAALRHVLEDGLYDLSPDGISDFRMWCAATGQFRHPAIMKMNLQWRKHFLCWAVPFYQRVKGRIGYTKGKVRHLSHDRRFTYENRIRAFEKFTPQDVVIDNGIWKWINHEWLLTAFHQYK